MNTTWETKSGIKITGKPSTKVYYLLLRDRNGFEKKFRNQGFVPLWRIEDSVPKRTLVGSNQRDVAPKGLSSSYKDFHFKEWLNNSTALYNEY